MYDIVHRLIDIESKLVVTSRKKEKIGGGDEEVETINTMYEINKLQGVIVQHRTYSQNFIIMINGL